MTKIFMPNPFICPSLLVLRQYTAVANFVSLFRGY